MRDVQAGFRKDRGTGDEIANICWIIEKSKGIPPKKSTSASLTTLKPLTVWITKKCGKFLEMEIPDQLTCLLRNLCAGQEATVRTRYGAMDWFKIGKGVHKAISCHLAYLTYMQSTSYDMPGQMTHKLESRLPGETPTTSDMHSIGRKQRGTQEPLAKGDRGE